MVKKILIGTTVVLVMYAVLPMTVIDFIGKFAIGWMVMDIVNSIIDYRNIGRT